MNILELHYSTAAAGAERVVIDLCNELAKIHDVTLCTILDDNVKPNTYYKKELSSDVKYINLGCKYGSHPSALWSVSRIIRKLKPDIVHAHTNLDSLFLTVLFNKHAKYVHTLHNSADYCLSRKWLKSTYYKLYSSCVQPIVISKENFNSYKRLYGLDNAIIIDNGRANLKKSYHYDEVTVEIDSLKLHDDDKVFVHVARFSNVKNQPMLVDAFTKYLADGNHGILLMLGAGYDDFICNTKIVKGIYSLGIKNNVCDYLLHADFFMLSSFLEGLPISLLEAMSVGVIPICTPAGGIKDVLKDENIGFMSKSFEVEEYYSIIKKAVLSQSVFDKKRLIQYFRDNYSIERCASKYIDAFKCVLNDKN